MTIMQWIKVQLSFLNSTLCNLYHPFFFLMLFFPLWVDPHNANTAYAGHNLNLSTVDNQIILIVYQFEHL